MKLIAAQISSIPGDIEANIAKHVRVVHSAAGKGADVVVFPELSITGYDSRRAGALALLAGDNRFDVFQALSEQYGILIAIGAPLKGAAGTEIGMLVFQPGRARAAYSKQLLHADELPFFTPGRCQQVFTQAGQVIAPAICYESLQPEHAEQAAALGARVYLASVAKSERGVRSAYGHYPVIARRHGMTVIMANCVGPAEDYMGAGQSAVWNGEGELVCGTDAFQESLVAYDTHTRATQVCSPA